MSGIDNIGLRYVFAGTACMTASFATNPIDVTKIRMQLDGELAKQRGQVKTTLQNRYYKGIFRGAIRIAQDEGILALYKGLTPALIREAVYSTIRIGSYEPIKVFFGATDPSKTPLYKKICAGGTAGAIGSSIATPTDLIRVRLQAQGRPGFDTTYSGFTDAVTSIVKKEGLRGLYRGMSPTVQRAIVLTAAQTSCYDHTKHSILNAGLMTEGGALHILSSMIAGLMAAAASSPVDVIKTRIMNQKIDGVPKDQIMYKNTLDCLLKTLRSEGMFGLYKGFIPNWLRIGPHTIISFFLFEQFRHMAGIKPI
ncbi:mitochondrial substrate carrier family protein ucpB-like [Anneissia japonica]|uniref:mitochondrial substrate carrier family protein ucpB-like n=1 Tax=Anneissia japonica TaxID=1529436 RepID=UPI0014257CF9|nr:mitochondrial substrate carrier family protein ucpB-like [Anneissia japonica]